MRFSISLLILFVFHECILATSFQAAVSSLSEHEEIKSIMAESRSVVEGAKNKGSWGDPRFKVAAKNYPIDTLKNDQTPMTGLEFGLSQNIALSNKYSKIEESAISTSKSLEYKAKNREQFLIKSLWSVLIEQRKVQGELSILKSNLQWLTKNIKISKKLYANGKVSQQAILDIQIRKSEIEAEIYVKEIELLKSRDNLDYLIGTSRVQESTIPWKLLSSSSKKKVIDFNQLSHKENLKASVLSVKSTKLNYFPDVTVAVSYTKRSDIDDNGDFVGASISFPIPTSSKRYAGHEEAISKKYRANFEYKNYERTKKRKYLILSKEIESLRRQLEIINKKTIKFAKNSRYITSRSYGLGSASYIELLQSELRYQRILMSKVTLESQLDLRRVEKKYILGEALSE